MDKSEQSPPSHKRSSVLKRLARLGALLWLLFVFCLTVTALVLGGYLFVLLGLCGLSFGFGLLVLCSEERRKKGYLLLVPLFIPLYLILPIRSNYSGTLKCHSVFNETVTPWFGGLPEKDIVKMGENFGYSTSEKKSLEESGFMNEEYPEIVESDLFGESPSLLLDSWFCDRGQYWYYQCGQKNAPLLIFLHGSGGSFRNYQQWFCGPATTAGINVAFPNWGLGIWKDVAVGRRLQEVLSSIRKNYDIDEKNVYLCGLSQGALLSLESVARGYFDPAGVVAVSGVPTLSANELARLSEKPLLIIHGDKDERLSVEAVRSMSSKLENLQADFNYREYTGFGHTLIKIKKAEIVEDIFTWVKSKSGR